MQAFIQTHATRPDGSRDSFATIAAEVKQAPLWWQDRGLSFTATGYGSRIPTAYVVRFNGRWRRVYCRIYSNIGTTYIGRGASKFIVNFEG
jgi:hypothetical protein